MKPSIFGNAKNARFFVRLKEDANKSFANADIAFVINVKNPGKLHTNVIVKEGCKKRQRSKRETKKGEQMSELVKREMRSYHNFHL